MPTKSNRHLLLVVYCGVALLLLLVLLSVTGVDGQYVNSNATQRKAHYCGTKLSDTLAELCSTYNGFRKKSDNMLMNPYPKARLLDQVEQNVEQLQEMNDRTENMIHQALETLEQLNSHEHHFRRIRRQVVAECCYQSCTLDTLRSYCAN